jgi:hypothetical protein
MLLLWLVVEGGHLDVPNVPRALKVIALIFLFLQDLLLLLRLVPTEILIDLRRL